MNRVFLVGVVMACGNSKHPVGGDAASSVDGLVDTADASGSGYAVARSGARLKLSWFQTADGVRSPIDDGFYDVMFGTTCKPTTWTDASVRCTPQTSPSGGGYDVFTDASCSTPVFANMMPYPAGTFFSTYTQPPSLCGGILVDHIVTPGAEVFPAQTYTKSGTDCVAFTHPGEHFYPVVDLPETMFVAITNSYDATGAVKQMHWDSPDGMGWYRPEGYDTALAAECSYQTETTTAFDATAGICDPRGQMVTGYATCTMPLLSRPKGCLAPTYARALDLCSDVDHRVFPVNGSLSPNPVYDASCTPGNPSPSTDYYAVSTTSVGNVQTLTRDHATSGTTRLQPIYFNSAGGVHYQTNIFYDTMLATQCAFGYSTGATTTTCLPLTGTSTMVLYSDVDCTMPFDALQVNDDPAACGIVSPTPDFAKKNISTGVFEYHRVAAQHVTTVYTKQTGNCLRYPELGIPQPWRIFEIDPTVVSSFETAAIVVDP